MSEAPETIYIEAIEGELLEETHWLAERIDDTEVAYIRADIAYGFASEVEKLREYIAKKEWTQSGEALRMRAVLQHISRNASVMTAHQIETMARDALEGE